MCDLHVGQALDFPQDSIEGRTRRSSRNASRGRLRYHEATPDEEGSEDGEEANVPPPMTRGKRYRQGWHEDMGQASNEAASRALHAANHLQETLINPAVVKEMSPSQVSGGFWCNMSPGFSEQFQFVEGQATLFLEHQGRKWKVKYLYQKDCNRSGLSGGWRGFAIDQRLFPNDKVVFEKVRPRCIRVYIFRACDYEEGGARKTLKEVPLSSPGTSYRYCCHAGASDDDDYRCIGNLQQSEEQHNPQGEGRGSHSHGLKWRRTHLRRGRGGKRCGKAPGASGSSDCLYYPEAEGDIPEEGASKGWRADGPSRGHGPHNVHEGARKAGPRLQSIAGSPPGSPKKGPCGGAGAFLVKRGPCWASQQPPITSFFLSCTRTSSPGRGDVAPTAIQSRGQPPGGGPRTSPCAQERPPMSSTGEGRQQELGRGQGKRPLAGGPGPILMGAPPPLEAEPNLHIPERPSVSAGGAAEPHEVVQATASEDLGGGGESEAEVQIPPPARVEAVRALDRQMRETETDGPNHVGEQNGMMRGSCPGADSTSRRRLKRCRGGPVGLAPLEGISVEEELRTRVRDGDNDDEGVVHAGTGRRAAGNDKERARVSETPQLTPVREGLVGQQSEREDEFSPLTPERPSGAGIRRCRRLVPRRGMASGGTSPCRQGSQTIASLTAIAAGSLQKEIEVLRRITSEREEQMEAMKGRWQQEVAAHQLTLHHLSRAQRELSEVKGKCEKAMDECMALQKQREEEQQTHRSQVMELQEKLQAVDSGVVDQLAVQVEVARAVSAGPGKGGPDVMYHLAEGVHKAVSIIHRLMVEGKPPTAGIPATL